MVFSMLRSRFIVLDEQRRACTACRFATPKFAKMSVVQWPICQIQLRVTARVTQSYVIKK
jgi:hypothetical protein